MNNDGKNATRRMNDRQFADGSKKQLLQIISKKFQTTMIGALDSFEKAFGYLWGHGKKTSELTNEEAENRVIWEQVRNDILNKGNNQSRAAQEEASRYNVTYEGYRTEFIIKRRNT